MKSTKLSQLFVGNVATLIFLLILAVIVTCLMVGDVNGMQSATTNYDYYLNAINLIDNIARTYFFSCFLLMAYLVYIKKQYSKWGVRLFYFIGASVLIYYAFAGAYIDYVFKHVEPEFIDKYQRLVHHLYTGPLCYIIIGYFFTPRMLKDAQKLQEEQDLTI